MKVKSIAECSLGASGSLMGPGTRCFTYQCVQLQTYESRTLFLMLSLQYYCILRLAEIKTLHHRDKIMRKDAGCAGNKITGSILQYF